MFAKIVKGKDLQALESEVNKYLNDVEYKPGSDSNGFIDQPATRSAIFVLFTFNLWI